MRKVPLHVWDRDAGNRGTEDLHYLLVIHKHNTYLYMELCITASFLQTRKPDIIWNIVGTLLLQPCYASDVGEESVCLYLLWGDCVCMCMSVWPLTLKECIRFLFIHLGYCMQRMFPGCVCPGFPIRACVSACRVCEITSLICRPSDTLHLFLHLASYDQGFKRGQVCSLLALTTWKWSSFIAHLLQVLLGAGGDFWHPSFFFPCWSYGGGKPKWSPWAHKTGL